MLYSLKNTYSISDPQKRVSSIEYALISKSLLFYFTGNLCGTVLHFPHFPYSVKTVV